MSVMELLNIIIKEINLQDYFKKNINILKNMNKDLCKVLENEVISPEWLQEIKNNFIVNKGAKVYKAYSDINNFNDLDEKMFTSQNVTICVGCGYGRYINSIIEKKEEGHIIIIYEKHFYFIKKLLQENDYVEFLKNGELIIVCQDDIDKAKEELRYIIRYIEAKKVIESWAVVFEQYIIYLPEDYTYYLQSSIEIVNQIQCNVGTVAAAGKMIAKNDIKNLPYVFHYRGVNEIKSLYKDKPAVIVSTGPSLHKNIHHLIDNQSNIIIIAVAQALRILLAYDIRPDFICTVDYGSVNLEHFEGLMHEDVPLVALNRSYAEIIKRYKGNKFICVSDGLVNGETVTGVMQQKGSLIQGGSVSHLCLGLAMHLGCNPIAITGQDLAYEGRLSHSPLADANGKLRVNEETGLLEWIVTDPRSQLKKSTSIMGYPQIVPGYFDTDVMTNIGLKSFITSFEFIANSNKDHDLYDCTEGGANKKGFKKETLKDFLFKNKKINIDKNIINSLLSPLPDRYKFALRLVTILKKEIENFDIIKDNCEKAIVWANKILRARKDETREKAIQKNAEYSNTAQLMCVNNQLIGLYIYDASRLIQSVKYKAKADIETLKNNECDRKIRVERNKVVNNAAIKACNELKLLYLEALEVINEYIKTKDIDILLSSEEQNINIDDADEYLQVGNWAHPLLDARYMKNNEDKYEEDVINRVENVISKCVKIREEKIKEAKEKEKNERRGDILKYNELINDSRKYGIEYDFEKSLDCTEKAIELFPDDFAARWGKATILNYCNRLQECVEYYDLLIKDYPGNNRLKFERAQVLIRIDPAIGFKEMKKVFEITDQFDYFLVYFGHMYREQGGYVEALSAYDEYIKKFPDSKEAWKGKLECYKTLNDFKDGKYVKEILECESRVKSFNL